MQERWVSLRRNRGSKWAGIYIFFLAVPLVVYGVLYNHAYYNYYGISITQYIDLSEAILLFIPQLLKNIFIILYSIGIYYVIAKTTFTNRLFFKEITRKERIYFLLAYVLVSLFFFFGWIFKFLPNSFGIRTMVMMGVIFFVPFIVNKFFDALFKMIKIDKGDIYKDFFYIGLVVLVIVINGAVQQIEKNSRINKYSRFDILLNDGYLMRSTNNLLLFGKTKEYVFIYNVLGKTTEVFKMDDVKKVTYYNN